MIATGVLHTVEEFFQKAFDVVSLVYRSFLKINDAYLRPGEAILLCGDASKAKSELDRGPSKNLNESIVEMVFNGIKLLSRSL